jgi:hypothetical protein
LTTALEAEAAADLAIEAARVAVRAAERDMAALAPPLRD